ncbi:MAG: outer membrane protein assembly factor BamD [Planctomycetota bacterium]|nr:outer membrane protein assembly factor BamD [Planctomycetota bacterium]
MKKLLIISLLGVLVSPVWGADKTDLIWKDGKWVRRAAPAEGTPAGEAALIRRKIDQKKYASAVKSVKKFLKRYPASPLAEEVLSLAGEAELGRKRYWQAYEWYERQLAESPGGEYFERALDKEMEIAEAFLAGRKRIALGVFRLPAKQEGIDILQGIAETAPSSPQAESALLRIGEYYFDKGKWRLSADAYENFLTLMPKSPRAPQAELALAEALLRSYRGPSWDETPLIEAQQRYKAFAASYPAMALKAQVGNVLKEIRSCRAEKQYENGRFYLRTKKPEAAAHHFRLIIEKYSDTEWAEQARVELTKLSRTAKPSGKTEEKPEGETKPVDAKKENKS